MSPRTLAIHADIAARLEALLATFLADSGAAAALLLDRGGQPLVTAGVPQGRDATSIGALAAAAFGSTAALARLLGETEFSALLHEGPRESLHVSSVDDDTILLALFDTRTTAGMVRLFAGETGRAIALVLEDSRMRPRRIGALTAPLTDDEARGAAHPRAV